MDKKELLQIIEEAVKNGTTELDLSSSSLSQLPAEISQLTNLTVLILNGNELKELPPEISQLTNLIELHLSFNSLRELPLELSQLTNLAYLSLSYNNLRYLSPEIGQLTNLIRLDFRANYLTSLPPEIGQLTNLSELYLSVNNLRELPPEVGQLTDLTWLDVRQNNLSELPSKIGQLANLITLDLSVNNLRELPLEISQLTNLIKLNLSSNRLIVLPPEINQLTNLTRLHIDDNHLNELPPGIGQLTNLTWLDLGKNPLEIPPLEIARNGTKSILLFFQQLAREGMAYLYEAKLLIVGEGEAGKTSLAQKIIDPSYELLANQATTEGIDIVPWHFPHTPEQEFQVNIWDFGGQEIYHATHQFFLTKRSLYVLVADNRKEHTDLYYWLNVVELLSDNSPLLIVQNEKDDRSVEINIRELRGRFDNLKETLPTNLKTNRGLDDILRHLKHHLSSLPHVGDKIPKTWFRVREALEASDQDYISLAEYRTLCRDNGLERMADQDQFSGYLHDLGVCLHFQDDLLLKQTVILKPTWGTDAVYRVLDNEGVKKNLGQFSQDDLALIWAEEKYAAKQAELLQLMTKFKLCYPLPHQPGWYIAPQLLTKNQPGYDWNEANNLLLRYEYKFMPKGIMTRFIVVMHPYIETQSHVWRSGIILFKGGIMGDKDSTRAEVIEYYDRREITVRIAGRYKRDLMIHIVKELDEIHATYARLKVSKLVPCHCSLCQDSQTPHFYDFESLRRRLAVGRREVECDLSYEMVNVRALLDDISRPSAGSGQSEAADLQMLIDANKRRRQKLKEKEGTLGLSADPALLIEIENIEAELERLQAELDRLA